MTIRQAYLMFTLNGTSGAGAVTTLFFDVVTDESWDGANIITEHPVETGSNVADNIRVGLRECQLTIFATNEPFQGNSFTIPQSLETVIGPFEVDGTAQIVPDTLVAQEWENGLQLSSAVQAGAILGSQAVGNLVPKLPTGAVNLGTTLGANLLTPAFAYPYPFTPNLGLEDNPGIQQSVGLLAQPDDTIDFVARMYEILELLRTSGTLITVYGSKNGCQNMAIESINMDRSADTGTGAEFIIKLKEIRFVSTQTVTAPQPTIKAAVTKVSKGNQNPTPATPPVTKSVAKRLFGDILNQGGGSPNAEQLSSTGLTPADLPNPAIDTGAP
jgi:hypothetical protein